MTETTRPTAPLPPVPPNDPGAGAAWIPVVRVLAVVLTVAVIGIGTVAVASTFAQRVHTETRTFTATAVRAVKVTEDVGDVRVRVAEPGERVTATARITESFDHGEWSAQLNGESLVVDGNCRQQGISLFDCNVDLTVVVPAGIPVDIESNTGDLNVDGGFSAVRARTNTGDVLVRRAAGPVQIRTDTGDVRSLATAATAVSAETSTGDVRLVFDVAPRTVSTETNTGDVAVLVPDDGGAYSVVTDTTTGDETVEVSNVPRATSTIIAKTDTGDVSVRYR
jgi:hypothetical protein